MSLSHKECLENSFGDQEQDDAFRVFLRESRLLINALELKNPCQNIKNYSYETLLK